MVGGEGGVAAVIRAMCPIFFRYPPARTRYRKVSIEGGLKFLLSRFLFILVRVIIIVQLPKQHRLEEFVYLLFPSFARSFSFRCPRRRFGGW